MLRARLDKDLDKVSKEFLSSLEVDKEFTHEDLWNSQAHVIMLFKQKILPKSEASQILKALEKAGKDLEAGKLKFGGEEDIHPVIEQYVIKDCGPVGGKLHTARSRNDQVATDTRMHARTQLLDTMDILCDLIDGLIEKAKKHNKDVMPGFTHLRHAQPITFGFFLSAYAHAIFRDLKRMNSAFDQINMNPLGACALSGTSFKIDRKLTTKLLGFDSVMENALDAVASRDFVAEVCSDISILMSTLSRLAGELIFLSSEEIRLIELDDAYCSTSSIMPHKKNPDTLELIKGKTAGVYSASERILVLLKGLPLTYGRDLQEDREGMWKSFKTVDTSMMIINEIVHSLLFYKQRGLEMLNDFSYAAEIANYLVREKGIPFRDAHNLIGILVKDLHCRGFRGFTVNQIAKFLSEQKLKTSELVIRDLINPLESVKSYASRGSSSPKDVTIQINNLQMKVKTMRTKIKSKRAKIEKAHKETEKMIKSICRS
jgi:argininosuccinate lyase